METLSTTIGIPSIATNILGNLLQMQQVPMGPFSTSFIPGFNEFPSVTVDAEPNARNVKSTPKARKSRAPSRKRSRKGNPPVPVEEPFCLMPIGSPDIVMDEKALNGRPSAEVLQLKSFDKKHIKLEPGDSYENICSSPSVSSNVRHPPITGARIVMPQTPMLGSSVFGISSLPIGTSFLPHQLVPLKRMEQIPFSTPNQQIYCALQEGYPKWKKDFIKTAIKTVQTNSLLRRHMYCITERGSLHNAFLIIEKKFEHTRLKVIERLTYGEKQELANELLHSLVSYELVLNEKRKELSGLSLYNWLSAQLTETESKQYFNVTLPTFQEIMNTIEEAFLSLKIEGLDICQKKVLVTCLQHDWTDPKSYQIRIDQLSHAVRLPPQNITQILQEARNKLRALIKDKAYYWSIDTTLPVLE